MGKIWGTAFVGVLFVALGTTPIFAAEPTQLPDTKGDVSQSEEITPPRADPAAPHVLIYPPIANWNIMQGSVIVQMLVGSDGWVKDARIETSSGYQQLDAAALITIGYWHYLPGKKGQSPVAMLHRTKMTFTLNQTSIASDWKMRPAPPIPAADDQAEIPTDTSHFLLYPQIARRTAQNGDVTLAILIRAEGYVSDADIIHSSGSSQLDSAALVSAGYWDYLPAIKGGVAVDAWKIIKVHFSPPDSGPEAQADQFAPVLPTAPGVNDNGVSHTPAPPSVSAPR